MWFNLSNEDIKALGSDKLDARIALVERIINFAKEQNSEEAQHYRDCLQDREDLQCDANAVVSMGEDGGAYVMTWKWVSDGEFAK